MAESFIQYIASGLTDTYSIPFGYLDPAHITVSLDGVDTPFTFPSASQIQITSGNPTSGVVVEVRRTTPRDVREIVWQNASNLTATDLNTSDLQLLYITQEGFDLSDTSMNIVSDGTFDALSRRVKNLAAPVDGTDAVNKTYADSNLALTAQDVIDADASAAAAALSESNAALSASEANSSLIAVQTLYDDFDDAWLGAKASDPAVDNDGDALNSGDLYYNTTDQNLRVYDETSAMWLIIDLQLTDNSVSNAKLSDVATGTIKGRLTAGTGDPEDLDADEVASLIGQATIARLGVVELAKTSEVAAGAANVVPDAAQTKFYVDTHPMLPVAFGYVDTTGGSLVVNNLTNCTAVRNSAGSVTVTLDAAMDGTDYTVVLSYANAGNLTSSMYIVEIDSTTEFTMRGVNDNNLARDGTFQFIVMGTKA